MSSNAVLVTGGSGFIGAWVLRELLGRGKRAVALDVKPAAERWNRVLGDRAKDVEFSDISLTDRNGLAALMKEHGVSHVIHLAALLTPDCQKDPFLGCQVNVLGSTAVFDAARLAGSVQAIALASSYAVYGEKGSDESQQPMFYGTFKHAVDAIAGQYWRHYGIRSLAIRLTWCTVPNVKSA
ncbi:MAG: NAD(P)-dependent oxidoreductase [Gemmataceae bacterium]